jgi:MFS family permease
MMVSLFITNLEIPIVTTSLVAITNDFGTFDNVGWVISSYLLGYVGMHFPGGSLVALLVFRLM